MRCVVDFAEHPPIWVLYIFFVSYLCKLCVSDEITSVALVAGSHKSRRTKQSRRNWTICVAPNSQLDNFSDICVPPNPLRMPINRSCLDRWSQKRTTDVGGDNSRNTHKTERKTRSKTERARCFSYNGLRRCDCPQRIGNLSGTKHTTRNATQHTQNRRFSFLRVVVYNVLCLCEFVVYTTTSERRRRSVRDRSRADSVWLSVWRVFGMSAALCACVCVRVRVPSLRHET